MTTMTAKREPAGKAKVGAGKEEGAQKGAKKTSPLKNKKVLILLVCVLAVAGAAYKMLMPTPPAGPPKGGDIVAMDPTTLNLTDGHYLKIAVAIQLVAGKASATSFQNSQASELIIDEFSDRTVASLSSNGARQKLMNDLKTQMAKAYPGAVYKLYLTQFVTQ